MKTHILSALIITLSASAALAQAGTGADNQRRDRTYVQETYGRQNRDGTRYFGQDPNLQQGGYKQGCASSGCNYGPAGTGTYAPGGGGRTVR